MNYPALIGLIGDVHAEDTSLEQAIEGLTARGAELIVCAGDIADGPGSLDRCCDLLATHGVLTVAGNHDRMRLGKARQGSASASRARSVPSARTLKYLAGLPAEREIMTANGMLILCHGLGNDDLFRMPVGPPDAASARRLDSFTATSGARWLVCGHVHQRYVLSWNDVTFINAGTLATDFSPCYGLLDVVGGDICFFDLPTT